MKSIVRSVFVMLISLNLMSQETDDKVKRKFRGPIWTTHAEDTDIVGVSLSFFGSHYSTDMGNNRTFGLRVEPSPFSIFEFLFDNTLLSSDEEKFNKRINNPANQQIYGINISTGTSEDLDVYGVSVVALGQYYHRANGLMLAVVNKIEKANGLIVGAGGNAVYRGNGVMISSVWGNGANYFNGVQISAFNTIVKNGAGIQIGLWNQAKKFRGIQIGLWNENDKRSLPIINWQFKG